MFSMFIKMSIQHRSISDWVAYFDHYTCYDNCQLLRVTSFVCGCELVVAILLTSQNHQYSCSTRWHTVNTSTIKNGNFKTSSAWPTMFVQLCQLNLRLTIHVLNSSISNISFELLAFVGEQRWLFLLEVFHQLIEWVIELISEKQTIGVEIVGNLECSSNFSSLIAG